MARPPPKRAAPFGAKPTQGGWRGGRAALRPGLPPPPPPSRRRRPARATSDAPRAAAGGTPARRPPWQRPAQASDRRRCAGGARSRAGFWSGVSAPAAAAAAATDGRHAASSGLVDSSGFCFYPVGFNFPPSLLNLKVSECPPSAMSRHVVVSEVISTAAGVENVFFLWIWYYRNHYKSKHDFLEDPKTPCGTCARSDSPTKLWQGINEFTPSCVSNCTMPSALRVLLVVASFDQAFALDSMQNDSSAILFGAFGALALAFGTAAWTAVSHLLAIRKTELPMRIRLKADSYRNRSGFVSLATRTAKINQS